MRGGRSLDNPPRARTKCGGVTDCTARSWNRKEGIEKSRPEKVFGLSIGFILPWKGTGANFYGKIALGGMYTVAALQL